MPGIDFPGYQNNGNAAPSRRKRMRGCMGYPCVRIRVEIQKSYYRQYHSKAIVCSFPSILNEQPQAKVHAVSNNISGGGGGVGGGGSHSRRQLCILSGTLNWRSGIITSRSDRLKGLSSIYMPMPPGQCIIPAVKRQALWHHSLSLASKRHGARLAARSPTLDGWRRMFDPC